MYTTPPPLDTRTLLGRILGIILITIVLFIFAISHSGCTSVKIKNKNISYPCCNKQVCEARRVLLTSSGYHVYHNFEDGKGFIYVGKLKTQK
jgi:hypothetical protein